MNTQIQARGFTLTQALLISTEAEVAAYRAQFPHYKPRVSVRLFDVNASRGGIDKGCLAAVQLGHMRLSLVTTAVDSDLYRAISTAFTKLRRATRSAILRRRADRKAARRKLFTALR